MFFVSKAEAKPKIMPYALRPGYPAEWGGGCRESIDYKRNRLPPKMINGLPTLIPIAGLCASSPNSDDMYVLRKAPRSVCHPFVYVSRRKREREKERMPCEYKIHALGVLLHALRTRSHVHTSTGFAVSFLFNYDIF